ncbi:hypothetical protein BDR07DRAFT_1382819 [Suillus spraguei]|nr:hypothetical protein BDR07DRAFT_1382819 [Suillus spraguei]
MRASVEPTLDGGHGSRGSEESRSIGCSSAVAVESITLQSLPDFFGRDSLPDEFTLENIECKTDELLTKIYEWVFGNFDREKPLHKIALLAGIYFSHVLPDMFWDVKDKPTNDKLLGEYATTHASQGKHLRAQFVAMVPAYIISVYERESPLREYFNNRRAFPTPWNAKNSAKGIGSLNLVRMGAGKGPLQSDLQGGAPLSDWVLSPTRSWRRSTKKRPAPEGESDSEVEIIEHAQNKRHRR